MEKLLRTMSTFNLALILFTLVCATSFTIPTYAQEGDKPSVAILFVNNGKTTYDPELGKKALDNLNNKLKGNYSLSTGERFIEKLNKSGINDITTAERTDIIQAFKGENIDFVVYVELQPVLIKSWRSMFNIGNAATVTMPLKIVDIQNNKYLYNGKFVEQADNSSMLGGVGTKGATLTAMDKIFPQLNEVLSARIPISVVSDIPAIPAVSEKQPSIESTDSKATAQPK